MLHIYIYTYIYPPNYHNNGFLLCTWVHDAHWCVISYTRCTVLWSNGLAVRALNFQSWGPKIKTSNWLQCQLSNSSFEG